MSALKIVAAGVLSYCIYRVLLEGLHLRQNDALNVGVLAFFILVLWAWARQRQQPEAPEDQPKRSRYLSREVRREVWRRDQGRCVDCGCKEFLEFNHIVPFSRGGSNTARNIELLCEPCNRKRSNNL